MHLLSPNDNGDIKIYGWFKNRWSKKSEINIPGVVLDIHPLDNCFFAINNEQMTFAVWAIQPKIEKEQDSIRF